MDNGIALMWVGIGVLFAAMALPLKLRKVKMNSFYGYRTALSYRSDKDWYALNEYAGRLMLFYSIPIIVLGIFLLFVSSEFVNAHRLVCSFSPMVPIGVMLVQLLHYTYKVYDVVEASEPPHK